MAISHGARRLVRLGALVVSRFHIITVSIQGASSAPYSRPHANEFVAAAMPAMNTESCGLLSRLLDFMACRRCSATPAAAEDAEVSR